MKDEKEILRAQVQALAEQLDSVENTLNTMEIESPELREALRHRFINLFATHRSGLNSLSKSVERGRELRGLWTSYAEHRSACEGLFDECMSFLGGVLLRRDKLDRGICEIADALLKYISTRADNKWGRLSVLSPQGSYFTEMTEMIRLPFPDFTIWNLPIAVHELGHYHSTHYPAFMNKVEQARNRESRNSDSGDEQATNYLQKEAFLHEFFADLFAVYTLGPAYVACCFVTRFSPADKNFCSDGATHPSHAKRGHLLLLALEEMNEESDPSLSGVIRTLKKLWQRNLKVMQDQACSDEPYRVALKFQVLRDLFVSILGGTVSARYPKDGWARAHNLMEVLGTEATAEQLLSPADTIVDVLNGAWAWRLAQPTQDAKAIERVDRKARRMCLMIAQRPQPV